MKHDHAPFAGIGHNQPCQLCGCIDREALIEQMAEALWDSRQTGDFEAVPWLNAGELWHVRFRELAETAIDTLSAPASCLAGC